MLSRHPERNQEWKEGHDGQAGRVHGQGGAQVQGVTLQHGQEDEELVEETGAWRSPVNLPPLPSSPSTSGGSTRSSPSIPMIPKTPGRRPPRVVTTPLWKRKSLSQMWSSTKSSIAAIKRQSQSQTISQEGKRNKEGYSFSRP